MKWVQIDAPRSIFLHSTKSLEILSRNKRFEFSKIVYDSTAFQFWGSDQYRKNIPLNEPHSYLMNPKNLLFSRKDDISEFSKRVMELNTANLRDQTVFYLNHSPIIHDSYNDLRVIYFNYSDFVPITLNFFSRFFAIIGILSKIMDF